MCGGGGGGGIEVSVGTSDDGLDCGVLVALRVLSAGVFAMAETFAWVVINVETIASNVWICLSIKSNVLGVSSDISAGGVADTFRWTGVFLFETIFFFFFFLFFFFFFSSPLI